MISGNLKWRAQERRRAEVAPMFMRAKKVTPTELDDVLRQASRIASGLWVESKPEPSVIQRIHFPQWRNVRHA